MVDFNYQNAVEELEKLAAEVEDPSTGLDDIDKYVKRSGELVNACRTYLRKVRDKVDNSFGQ